MLDFVCLEYTDKPGTLLSKPSSSSLALTQPHFKALDKSKRGAAQLEASKNKASAASSAAKEDKPNAKKRKHPGQGQDVTPIGDT